MNYRCKFDNYFSSQRPFYSLSNKVWNPPTDIYETEEATCIRMEVAGLEVKDLQVIAQRHYLVVRGNRQPPRRQKKVVYHLMEVHYDQFERVFEFSQPIPQDAVKVTYRRGFLLVEVKKQKKPVTQVNVQILDDLPTED